MYSSIKRIALFLIPLFLILALLELTSSCWVKKSIGKPGEYSLFQKQRQSIKTFFIGDSHMICIDTRVLNDSSFLFWQGALDLYYMKSILEANIDSMPQLKTIVIDLNYFTFSNSNTLHNPKLINDFYLMGFYPNNEFDIRNLSTLYSKKSQLIDIIKTIVIKKVFRHKESATTNSTKTNEKGRFDIVKQLESEEEFLNHAKFKNYEHGHTVVYAKLHPEIFEQNKQYLLDMINLANKHKVKLIAIQTPHHLSYIHNYQYFKEYYSCLNDILKKQTFQYYDFSKIFDSNQNLFRDSDHVNAAGSEIISSHLKKLI
jgi:hypothetical protein